MPGRVQQQHHHRSTSKTAHKPFKPRFTSKNTLRDASKGRIERFEKGTRKTTHQQTMSKLDRRNQAKQRRLANDRDHERMTSVFAGRDGAPRMVAVVPLCEDVDSGAVIHSLNDSVDAPETIDGKGGYTTVERFKQKIQFITPQRELLDILDACSIADYVICILSAKSEADDFAELILKSIEGQGISNVYTAAQHIETVEPPKRRPQILLSLKSYITHFFPNQEKVFSLESRQECQNTVRFLCTTTPRGVSWRSQRSWLHTDDVLWLPREGDGANGAGTASNVGELVLTGVVRGQKLKADRLVYIGDWGGFQISKVTMAPLVRPARDTRNGGMVVDQSDVEKAIETPGDDQDTLDELAPEEAVMNDVEDGTSVTARSMAIKQRNSVFLDEEQYYPGEENEHVADLPKRLPRGTSEYQSAWYLGDESGSGSDMDDDIEDLVMEEDTPADGASSAPPLTEAGLSTTAPSELGEPSAAESDEEFGDDDLDAYRSKKSTMSRAEADRQFPDEIELPPSVEVRDRLSRYRGLKNAKSSPWLTEEDKPHEPSEWSRLLDIADYRAAKAKVLRDSLVGGVKSGTRVNLHVRDVPKSFLQSYEEKCREQTIRTQPLKVFSLLRHEHKHTAIHSTFTISSDFRRPVENKEELVVQVGMRRFVVNPIFTAVGATTNEVHKVERWAWPGTTVVASWIGPLTWGAVPVLWYIHNSNDKPRRDSGARDADMAMDEGYSSFKHNSQLQLLGTGTLLPPNTSRILAKRAILSGQPAAIHRNVTTVRYMFFNREDVAYFRSLPLWTNRGRRGQIKEALGTHGRFKAVFENAGGRRVNVQESVKVSLWKRVWPTRATLLCDIL